MGIVISAVWHNKRCAAKFVDGDFPTLHPQNGHDRQQFPQGSSALWQSCLHSWAHSLPDLLMLMSRPSF